ncbi:MAG: hypothetical protein ACTSSN_06885 [Candidatus Heimdallarchaeaceae archaeon]
MTKMNIWSSGAGIVSALFMLAATTGAVLQFIAMYLPLFQAIPGGIVLMFFIFSIAAMAFGAIAIIVSIFGIPKVLWVLCAFFVFGFTLVFPIIVATQGGGFLYVQGGYFQIMMMDAIGFWLAAGGGLLAFIIGFFVPSD